jgi:hypothetical protein
MLLVLVLGIRPGAAADVAVKSSKPLAADFSFKLSEPALTSAGVFDGQGRLVQVLWNRRQLPAGEQSGHWDGQDQFHHDAPAGDYEFRVVVNHATYKNVGAIGNSGRAPTPEAHTPTAMASVATDAKGAIYTANGWDEAGADFKKWDADGNAIYDGRYQMRNGNPNGAPYSIAVDDTAIYCGMEGWASAPWNHKQQVQRFALSDGKLQSFTHVDDKFGHIQVYEWPEKMIPPGTPPADAELMRTPLRAIAVAGDSLWVADALGGKVRRYHKITGEAQTGFDVKLPTALAIDGHGRIWVGHEHTHVSVFSTDGKLLANVLDNLGEIVALAFDPSGRLVVADSAAGQIYTYNVAGNRARKVGTFGQKAVAGDLAADHFFLLRGVAVDPAGFMVTIQTEPAGGARLARWSPQGKLVWEHFGAEFVSLGNYGAQNPDIFYSMTFHRYRLLDHAAGRWEYTGEMLAAKPAYHSDVHGVPRLLELGGHEFWFMPTGDGVQVYRVEGSTSEPQEVSKNASKQPAAASGMRLVSILGGGSPGPDGKNGPASQWTWTDASDEGRVAAIDIKIFKKAGEAHHAVFGVDVDLQGNVWFGEQNTQAIWTVPMAGLSPGGNPTYDWAAARQVVPKDASALGFQPTMVQHAADGSLYAFGWSTPWPSPKNNPFWMGGTTLVHFDAAGKRLWAVPLPAVCVGLDAIPGGKGGCIVGTGEKAELLHFSADGLLIGSVGPGEAMNKQSGWFDNHACVAVNRDPRDGILDVFAEDDFVLRIGWYRIDDRRIETITGKLAAR